MSRQAEAAPAATLHRTQDRTQDGMHLPMYRRIAGAIALIAMLLSLGEGVLAGFCPPSAPVASDAPTARSTRAPATGHATDAHAAHARQASTDDGSGADHERDASAGDCPMTGAAPAGCGGFAVALAVASQAPAASSIVGTAPLLLERIPASRAGLPLLHPPRA